MIWSLFLACGDVKPTDSGDVVPQPEDSAIEEESSSFDPKLFTIYASFGVEGGNIRSFWIQENEILPNIQLVFYNADYSESCIVAAFWESERVVLDNWVFEDMTDADNPVEIYQKGFSIPDVSELQISTSDGCADWDTTMYGTLEDKINHAWGLGFGGSLRADVETAILESENEQLRMLYENDYLIAGSWSADLWEPSRWASHTFTVSPQEDWQLSVDADGAPTDYYTRSEVENGEEGSIYLLLPIFLWDYDTFF